MNSFFYCHALGWILGCIPMSLGAQTEPPDSTMAQTQTKSPAADTGENTPPGQAKHWILRNARICGGQITLPFKIREDAENHTFRLTTDVTLGGFVGYTRKLGAKGNYSLTLPFTAGVTFININNNNTSLRQEQEDATVVPGLSWCTGIILQMESYSVGLLFGKDYASEVGNQWAYHGKTWWSFGVGFVFLQ